MYQHSNGRIQRRGSRGRFQRSTLQNTFGLLTAICPACGAINPYDEYVYTTLDGFTTRQRNDPPTHCNQCNHELNKDT